MFEFFGQLLGGHVNDRHPILRHQVKQLVAVYAEEVGCFALRNLVFPQEFHGEGFFGFGGQVLITEVGGHLIGNSNVTSTRRGIGRPPFTCSWWYGIGYLLR